MYLSNALSSKLPRGKLLRQVAIGNVLAFGFVSLVTDISSEMVTAVLPAYLVLSLNLSLVSYGILDGVYTGATALTRLLGGWLSDRYGQRKLMATLGYGLSAVSKIGLLFAGTPTGLGGVLGLDRTGKGLRTAPRDALIAAAVPADKLGQAFGLHRSMDAVGAFAGPLVAAGILAATVAGTGLATTQSYRTVFAASLGIAILGVLVLVLFVRNSATPSISERPRFVDLGRLLTLPGFRGLVICATLLGFSIVGDGFVYLALTRRHGVRETWFPLLAAGTSLVFVLAALPLGRVADRWGRWKVVAGGYTLLALVYALLPVSSVPAWILLLGYGLFYAATDGVLPALAVPLLPEALKATGLAWLATGQALAYLVSSVAFGLAWAHLDLTTACLAAAGVALVVVAVTTTALRRSSNSTHPDTTMVSPTTQELT